MLKVRSSRSVENSRKHVDVDPVVVVATQVAPKKAAEEAAVRGQLVIDLHRGQWSFAEGCCLSFFFISDGSWLDELCFS
jgi:hypothetical protein